MATLINLVGTNFGRLSVVSRAGNSTRGDTRWECLCACGKGTTVAGNHLRNGAIVSCGCFREDAKKTHGRYRTPEYTAWGNMIARCTNTKHPDYSSYGGRGITVCARWVKFENFFSDMGDTRKGLSIERIDNNKGYFKENCRWATPTEQALNKRIRVDNSSGCTGVYLNKRRGGWDVQMYRGGKCKHVGHFANLQGAISARKQAEEEHGKVQ